MSTEGQKKFKLRRPGAPQKAIIEKNLEPLRQNEEKKKFAQQLYYQNMDCTSPMRKEHVPVHERLGTQKTYRLHKIPAFYGTNTSAILPKKRKLRRVGTLQAEKRQRIMSAQSRLNNIRSQQNQYNNNIQKKTFKLRRNIPNNYNRPTNLKVEIKNREYFGGINQQPRMYKKFKMIINPHTQMEIRSVQREGDGRIYDLDDYRPTPVCTFVTLHDRFGSL